MIAFRLRRSNGRPSKSRLSDKSNFNDFTCRVYSDKGDFRFSGLVRQPLFLTWRRHAHVCRPALAINSPLPCSVLPPLPPLPCKKPLLPSSTGQACCHRTQLPRGRLVCKWPCLRFHWAALCRIGLANEPPRFPPQPSRLYQAQAPAQTSTPPRGRAQAVCVTRRRCRKNNPYYSGEKFGG